jgi:hypothetical protein
MRNITPPERYTPAERLAARLSAAKSRFFLVLGLGWQLLDHDNPIPPAICSLTKPRALLKVIRLKSNGKGWSQEINVRICIELKGRQSPRTRIAAANRIVGAIGALFTFVHHTNYQDIVPYQIPKELMSSSTVNVDLIERFDELTTHGPIHHSESLAKIRSSIYIPDQSTAMIFYLLPFVLQNEDLFNACSFFRSCCSEYSFMDGVVSEVLYDPRRQPVSEPERLGFENVVLQSFRVIEAIVGEPGKEDRFRQHLAGWGLDYDEAVGFGRRRRGKLGDRIRWLQEARDSAAAHGKRRRKSPFTLFEAMEAQHLAESTLHRALWFTADSQGRLGDDDEIAFLLSMIFPDPSNRDWVSDRKIFKGKSAVDLAQTPEGLPKIAKFYERRRRTRPVFAVR